MFQKALVLRSDSDFEAAWAQALGPVCPLEAPRDMACLGSVS